MPTMDAETDAPAAIVAEIDPLDPATRSAATLADPMRAATSGFCGEVRSAATVDVPVIAANSDPGGSSSPPQYRPAK